jgi:hypothetical protein
MSTLISNISNTKLKLRWEEPYVSQALNKQFGAGESGILFGFTPSPGGGLSLTLGTNSETGTSAMAVRDTAGFLSVLYVEEADLTLDLTSFAGTKVWLGVSVSYATGVATSGQIRAYTAAEVSAGLGDVDVICSVDVPSSGSIVADDIGYAERSFYWLERIKSGDFAPHNGVACNSHFLDTALYVLKDPSSTGISVSASSGASVSAQSPRVLRFAHVSGSSAESRIMAVVESAEADFVFVRYRAKYVSASASAVGIRVRFLSATPPRLVISTVDSTATLSSATQDWTEFKSSFVAPAGAFYAEVSIYIDGLTAGQVYFEKFFVTSPKSGGYHDAQPTLTTQSFLAAGFYGGGSDQGLVRFDPSGYFGLEAISAAAQVKSDTGVRIIATAGDIELSPTANLLVSGGYGSTGVTISSSGSLSMNGSLVVDGAATIAGGYASSGVSIDSSGNVSMSGSLTIDGTMSRIELTTPVTKTIVTLFSGYDENEMVYTTGTAPAFTQQSATHAYSGRSVRKANGWQFTSGAGNTGHFLLRTPRGSTITDIKLLTVDRGTSGDNGNWTAHIYTIDNAGSSVQCDQGLKYIQDATVNNHASLGVLNFTALSLNTDAGWSDFESEGMIYLDVSFVTASGSPSAGQRQLAGVSITYEFAEMADVPS